MPEVVERRYRSRDDDQQALVVLGKTWPATQVRCPICQGLVRLDAEQCLVCKTELNQTTQLRSAAEQMQARIRQSEAREAEARDRLLRHETKWEIIPLQSGELHCSWINPETRKLEQRVIPKEFNPFVIERITFDGTKENCSIAWGGGKRKRRLKMPTSLFRTLEANIPPPVTRRASIEVTTPDEFVHAARFHGVKIPFMRRLVERLIPYDGKTITWKEILDFDIVQHSALSKYLEELCRKDWLQKRRDEYYVTLPDELLRFRAP